MKYSIIMPVLDNLAYTVQAVGAVLEWSRDFELIVVDGGSTDGTQAWLRDVANRYYNVHFLDNLSGGGFCTSVNLGTLASQGQYVVWLNNDTLVTPVWLELLCKGFKEAPKMLGVGQVGLVGPLTNSAGGRQCIDDEGYTLDRLGEYAEHYRDAPYASYSLTGFLSGFCLMFPRCVHEKIGLLDEMFNPGGFGDNDFVLRAGAAGYHAAIATRCFVHHFGGVTFDLLGDAAGGGVLANRGTFYAKYEDDRPKKLVAAYRVRNEAAMLRRSLAVTSRFADEIVVLCDRCTDDTAVAARCGGKVVEIVEKTGKFDEMGDRVQLLEMAYKREPDWVIVIDADEEYESKFDHAYAQRLMHPVNPQIKAYGFRWMSLWDSPNHYRTDGIFGDIHGLRMFKVERGQALATVDPKGFHMPTIPQFGPEAFRWTNIRIRHWGYSTPMKRQEKYDFYSAVDTSKLPLGIGGEDYSHLVEERVSIARYSEENTLSFLMVVEGDYQQLAEALDVISYTADEIVVVSTKNDPSVKGLAERYGAIYVCRSFRKDFAELRNNAKELCTKKWIFTLDPDERIALEFVEQLPLLLEAEADGYLFPVENFQLGGAKTTSEALRLFRNIPEFVYRGTVHENFDECVAKHGLRIIPAPCGIVHLADLLGAQERGKKLGRYKKMTQRDLRKDPKNKMARFNLALHLEEEGLPLKAIAELEKAKGLDDEYYHPRLQLGVVHLREAAKNLREVLGILPSDHHQFGAVEGVLAKVEEALK